MGLNIATFFSRNATVNFRAPEVPAASFTDGMNRPGSCAPGLGINTGNVNPKLSDWTVLNQTNTARAPQNSQYIGGSGLGDGSAIIASGIKADLDPDFNSNLHFRVADAAVGPGGIYHVGDGAINQTGGDVEIGDRLWGTVP